MILLERERLNGVLCWWLVFNSGVHVAPEYAINTKHGKAVAKLIPMPPETTLFGAMANSVKLEHDIDSTLCNDWEASCNGQTDE